MVNPYFHCMKHLILAFCLFIGTTISAQVPTPKQVLGYEPGEQFTPHYKIVNYFRAVAAALPGMVKVESYGKTYEGRELLLAYVSSPENIAQLDRIRTANLQAAGLQEGTATNDKAIVWLSYNVHGNEPSSSEASMATLAALVDPNNQAAKEWLKHTVVIIDPCLNPDGRDRYVNWYNSMKGSIENPDPQSREHMEPWPGGRSNHYNFDLNRDWAWQTQIETQQRVARYNQWMPHVHVDFHEQFHNNPYYFAPAAEPFHEVITPWQREFQTTIGKNNAAQFDKNGWLFFTKQYFDLFYPSYGDTYPTYNGAIGMTYEQAGHSAGGLAITTDAGDTLTLRDRVRHHTTTGLSTIEVTANNAAKVVAEFKKFFDENTHARNATYKTYYITAPSLAKLQPLTELLNRNNIRFGYTIAPVNATGYNYFNGKVEPVKSLGHTISISAFQPKSALVKVLMEPINKLADTATYDITAWSLPYAYGVQAYAVSQRLSVNGDALPVVSGKSTVPKSNYGYLIPYHSVESAKALAALLKQGIKVRVTDKPVSYKGKTYDAGSLMVLRTSNAGAWDALNVNTPVFYNSVPLETGFMEKGPDLGSADVRVLKAPKIAVLTGQEVSSLNAGEVWHFIDQGLEYPVSLINSNDIGRLNLNQYDVLVLPSGNYRVFNDKNGNERLKEYVRNGGRIVAMGNAVFQMANNDWGLKAREDKAEEKDKNEYSSLRRYADRERDDLVNSIPGAIYKVELDATHPLAFGYGETYYSLKLDADVYDFLKEGWNVGIVRKDNYVTGFAGTKVKSKIKDGLVFGVQPMGRGSVVYMADDPLFRLFWENGKLMFANALFMVN